MASERSVGSVLLQEHLHDEPSVPYWIPMTGPKRKFFEFVPRAFLLAPAILLGTLTLALTWEGLFHKPSPSPSAGTLDLRTWDFASSLPLGGTWEFEPDKLLAGSDFKADSSFRHVPDTRFFPHEGGFFGGSGTGTYRLVVLLPPGDHGLGLRYSTVWTAFEVEANGVIVTRIGTPSLSATSAVPAFSAGIVRIGTVAEKLDVVVRVSNHEYRWGGIVQPFVLGTTTSLVTQKRWDDMLVFLMVGALLGLAANALFLFAYRRDLVYLSFTAFALTVALRALTSGDGLISGLIPGLSFDSFIRLGFTSQYLLMPMAAIFFHQLFIEDVSLRAILWFMLPSAAFCGLLPFASINLLSWSLLPYFLTAMVQVGYGYVAVCLRPAIRHRPGGVLVLAAGTILLAAIILNVRADVFLSRAESQFPLDLTAFVIVQSLVMAKRFTWVFARTEELGDELKLANRQLMEEARAAEEARDLLKESLAEKDVLLREVHHRVKNSLQIVLSIISLQARRVVDPGALAAYTSVRDRIRAISAVHDRLYGLDSEKRIALKSYIEELLTHLGESYGNGPPLFRFESDAVEVPMDLCLELGLILTELVVNACRHAEIPLRGGLIRISLRDEGASILLSVADDGPGFPEGFLPEATKTVGFKIMHGMINQRGGSLSAFNDGGAVVQVRVPLTGRTASLTLPAHE